MQTLTWKKYIKTKLSAEIYIYCLYYMDINLMLYDMTLPNMEIRKIKIRKKIF